VKLSEAILLGSTILTPKAGVQHETTEEGQQGCALGMAAIANGCTYGPPRRPDSGESTRSLGTAGVWGEWVKNKIRRPCTCWFLIPRRMQIQEIITHLFDYHVMAKKADWTLDQLVNWVKTVEPVESTVAFQPDSEREPLARG
jgi:hypothetical protein